MKRKRVGDMSRKNMSKVELVKALRHVAVEAKDIFTKMDMSNNIRPKIKNIYMRVADIITMTEMSSESHGVVDIDKFVSVLHRCTRDTSENLGLDDEFVKTMNSIIRLSEEEIRGG